MIQRTPMRRRMMARRAMFPFGCLLLAALMLGVAGCGVTATGTGGSAPAAPTGSVNPGGPIKGTAVRPCPGPWASVHDVAGNVVVVTEATPPSVGEMPAQSTAVASAHVGDIIQVRVGITSRWTLRDASANLQKLDPQGGQDQQLNVCFWNFKATAAGDATISYTVAPNCDKGVPCPMWIRDVTFTVHVS